MGDGVQSLQVHYPPSQSVDSASEGAVRWGVKSRVCVVVHGGTSGTLIICTTLVRRLIYGDTAFLCTHLIKEEMEITN